MYKIYKVTCNTVVDFAAEELKRYLRMMMPRCGEIDIVCDATKTDGFRLGLMEDFGLSTEEAEDLVLDDILHIDTQADCGIIAGSNPRSILQAVYKYLTLNGCRWLFPGIDGEYIPIRDVAPTYYHKMADCRYRGQCNEGAESQQCMMDTIDFSPKIGLNTYMLEFDIPFVYYNWYYSHQGNTANREPEPVDGNTVLQWKRACEAEIIKRGMQFHDIGHGWTAEAFGISTFRGWEADAKPEVPENMRRYLAFTRGERGIHRGVPLNTNFCMSNPEARKIVTDYVCDYAQRNTHVTYLHVWLADATKNHCECDECRKKIPSDWYVVLLNEIDEELTRRNLTTRIVFCAYSDTAYEPTCEYIKNPQRFTMLLGAITRSYTYSVPKDPKVESFTPFVLNNSGRFDTMEEYIQRANKWREFAPCNSFAYEYHFWKHQFYAPGVLSMARRLYEDVLSYRDNGFRGIVEDGSQRSFFPNGLCYYVYAQTLFDNSVDYDALVEDYLRHAYGAHWERVMKYLQDIETHMPQRYLEAKHVFGTAPNFYCPEMEKPLREVEGITRQLEEDLKDCHTSAVRVQTVAIRLLLRHAEFCRGYANAMALKAVGKDDEAEKAAMEFFDEFGKYEVEMERYYDHMMVHHALDMVFTSRPQLAQ